MTDKQIILEHFEELKNGLFWWIDESRLLNKKDKLYIEDVGEYIAKMMFPNDEEILKEVAKGEEIGLTIEALLNIYASKVLTKKTFHNFIERQYPNSDYIEYDSLYLEYKSLVSDIKHDIKQEIENHIIECKKLKNEYENRETIHVPRYGIKKELSHFLEDALSETWHIYRIITKEEDRDYSELNVLSDYRVLWVESIRDKNNEDVITKSFRGNDFDVEHYESGKETFKGLVSTILSCIRREKNKTKNRKYFMIIEFLMTFKNIEIVKALLTNGHKDIPPIMDKKTFKKYVKDYHIQKDFENGLI